MAVIDNPAVWRATYFGGSFACAVAVDRCFKLSGIVSERRAFNQRLFNFACVTDVPYLECDSRSELSGAEIGGELGVSHGYGVIFAREQIEKFAHGIWNIHLGKLPDQRGRHPVGWSLIEGARELTVTAHSIDVEIDRGTLLSETVVPIEFDDGESEAVAKVSTSQLERLLNRACDAFRSGSGTLIGSGTYLPSLQGRWDSIDPGEHTSSFVFNLLRAKRRFGGVYVAGKRFSNCDFVCEAHRGVYNGSFFRCSDGKEIVLW